MQNIDPVLEKLIKTLDLNKVGERDLIFMKQDVQFQKQISCLSQICYLVRTFQTMTH